MDNRPECSPDEFVVKAIRNTDWHEGKQRFNSSLFEGIGTSVSRLSVLTLNELYEIFSRDLNRPSWTPPAKVTAIGEIQVQVIQEIGRNYENPIHLTVVEDPIVTDPANPAHAEIPQHIKRGLARQLIKELIKKLHIY